MLKAVLVIPGGDTGIIETHNRTHFLKYKLPGGRLTFLWNMNKASPDVTIRKVIVPPDKNKTNYIQTLPYSDTA